MHGCPAEQALRELLPYFEDLETRTQAIMHLLKDREGITDEQLAPYLEQAAKASNVTWRGARVRMEHLFSPAAKTDEKQKDKKSEQKAEQTPEKPADAKPEPNAEQASETGTAKRNRSSPEDTGQNKVAEANADAEHSSKKDAA